MARERFSLVTEDEKKNATVRDQIKNGTMTPEIYRELPQNEKAFVEEILFQMSSEQIEPNQGTSALEFILFAFMRIMMKKINGMSLTVEDQEIEASLNRILQAHQITNDDVHKEDWLFDYMSYAEYKTSVFLQNRKDHVDRKLKTIGEV